MTVLRFISALILLLTGIGVTILIPVGILSERIATASPVQLMAVVAMTAGLNVGGAWQIYRGKGRWFAWMASLAAAVASPGYLRLIGMIPLLTLFAEMAVPWVRKKRGHRPGEPDQTEKGAAQSRFQIVEFVVGFGVLILCGVAWRMVPEWLRPVTPENADGGWAALLCALWLTVFVHELGHAAGGALTGFRLTRFAVFFVEYLRTEKRGKLRFAGHVIGGFYMGIPRHLKNLERRQIFMTAAGPAAGFILSLVCWAVLWRAAGSITGLAFDILHTAMFYSTILSVANLVPMKCGNIVLDGRMIWNILRGNQEARQSAALLACLSSLFSELRPREWKPEWVEVLRENLDPGTASLLTAWAEDRLSESPGDAQALNDLARCSAVFGHYASQVKDKNGREELLFNRAWIRSRWAGQTEGLRESMEAVAKTREAEVHELLQLEAALCAAEGDTGDAVRLLGEAEKALAAEPATGMRAAGLSAVRAYREELMGSMGGAVVESV